MTANLSVGADVASLFGSDEFHARHLGPSADEQARMLEQLGYRSRQALIDDTIPPAIRLPEPLALPEPASEAAALAELERIAEENQVWRSYIGAGYHGTITPEAIRRNVLENPGWYTAYTPYQAEVAQGRLEALLTFQQMVADLSGLPVANASLLDEATAAAEAMALIRRASKHASARFAIDAAAHPQVIAVMQTRASWLGIDAFVCDAESIDAAEVFGAHVQTPDT
ncbi:MAG TPA: glycine dehydrogenase (aminomethyl-transferring), partial [Burkholderiaceae bacterium]|nr:glycine dehydrogenase (aminomethyl-transferring) [Burkholderiaceae bacterium]